MVEFEVLSTQDYLFSYVESKTPEVDTEGMTPLEAITACLGADYGWVAPLVLERSNAMAIRVPIDAESFLFHKAMMRKIEPREPVGDSCSVVGVVVQHGDKLRLVDGHHRLKWCFENDLEKGIFILLE